MYLRKLSVIGFKNIPESALDLRSRINCFVGDNGAGKTNLLDAVHYLAMCKSAFGASDNQSIRHGDDFFMLDGQFTTGSDRTETVVCSFRKGNGKSVKRNGKEYEKLSEHIGLIPVVMVSPSDSMLISDSADERRRYLNAALSQLDKSYIQSLVRYNRVLAERNKLLKSDSGIQDDVMEVLDLQLCEAGEAIKEKRQEMTGRLAPLVDEYYRILSDDREQVGLSYRSELSEAPMSEILERNRMKDRLNQFTTGGIHRDDLKMKIGDYSLRKYGSQGQQKSFLIALKLAQYRIASEVKGEKPILLLDDLFDKLDLGRVEKLLELVSGDGFGQIFITDCNKVRLEGILGRSNEDYSIFSVSDGNLTAL